MAAVFNHLQSRQCLFIHRPNLRVLTVLDLVTFQYVSSPGAIATGLCVEMAILSKPLYIQCIATIREVTVAAGWEIESLYGLSKVNIFGRVPNVPEILLTDIAEADARYMLYSPINITHV